MIGDMTLFVAVGIGVVVVFLLALALKARTGRRMLPDERLASVEERLGRVEGRLEKTEALATHTDHDVRNIRLTLQSMPTKDSVNDVKVQLGELRGELKAVTTTTSSMHHSLQRVEGFLFDAAAKRIAGVSELGSTRE